MPRLKLVAAAGPSREQARVWAGVQWPRGHRCGGRQGKSRSVLSTSSDPDPPSPSASPSHLHVVPERLLDVLLERGLALASDAADPASQPVGTLVKPHALRAQSVCPTARRQSQCTPQRQQLRRCPGTQLTKQLS
jgi:hypothetical protein